MVDSFVAQVDGISALAEPVRRALYFHVVAQPDPVSRDQAAAAMCLPRHTVTFHLDRLVQDGLLDTEYRRLSGRRGPGAGRPSKLYRRSARQLAVTLPERHYDLAGEILAQAIEAATGEGVPILESVRRAAGDAGRRLAATVPVSGRAAGAASPSFVAAMADLLARHGYEPRIEQDTIVLFNCPFHALARQHTELVCGMNLALINAALEELGTTHLRGRLDPAPDRCCVTLGVSDPEPGRRL